MKKTIILLFLIVFLQFSLSAEGVYLDSPVPVNPIVMGQGGSFTANAAGYNSLFKNPAGFAAGKGDVTVLSVNGWMFLDQSMLDFAQDPEAFFTTAETNVTEFITEFDAAAFEEWLAGKDQEEVITLLTDLDLLGGWDENPETLDTYLASIDWATSLTDPALQEQFISVAAVIYEDVNGEPLLPSGNIRAGLNTGFGIVKKGLGLGMSLNADATFAGQTIMNAAGGVSTTAALTGGYALELFDFLKVGAAVRPSYQAYSSINGGDLINGFQTGDVISSLDSQAVLHGWGIGFDAGAIASLGPFNIGLALTDIGGTRMQFSSVPWTDLYDALTTGGTVPEGSSVMDEYIVPMDVSLGASFHPDLGGFSKILDLDVSVELSDAVNALVSQPIEEFDPLGMFKFGAAARLFSILDVRAGYAGGYMSAGLGADLLFINLNVAGFLKATPETVGYSDYGVSAEVAFRF